MATDDMAMQGARASTDMVLLDVLDILLKVLTIDFSLISISDLMFNIRLYSMCSIVFRGEIYDDSQTLSLTDFGRECTIWHQFILHNEW